VNFYKNEKKLKVINAEGSMDEVYQSLLAAI